LDQVQNTKSIFYKINSIFFLKLVHRADTI